MTPKDEIIWKDIQKKNVKTFESYFKEHYKSFYLLACKYLKDSVQAEEIVNDVFMKLWEDGEKITIEISLKAYIYKAIINRSLNTLKKVKKDISQQTDIDLIPDESYELKEIEENELKIKLYAAIDKLPRQCRIVFEMSRFQNLKQQEIADKLDISIKTVKNHITYALKALSKTAGCVLSLTILVLKNILYFN